MVPSLAPASPIHFFEDVDMTRPVQFFLEVTAPQVSSYFSEMMEACLEDEEMVNYFATRASKFWTTLVVQASQTHASVLHSLVALSSLHEWIELTKRTPWRNVAFTRHYTKAIIEINHSRGLLPLEIILISCILFAHCDFLTGASAAGLEHLKSGYRIIEEHRRLHTRVVAVISELMEPIMEGFMTKSKTIPPKQGPGTPARLSDETTLEMPEMPETFNSLAHAHQYLQKVVYHVILLELDPPDASSTVTADVRRYLAEWSTAFDRWKALLDVDDPVLKDWHLLLQAHHRMARIILNSMPPENDKGHRRAAADFRIMFAQLRTFLRGGYAHKDPHNKTDILLSVHLGFIAPLFFIATQCWVHDIRRNALDALRELNVIEGHWNSCVAYVVAKKVIEIEEQSGDELSPPDRPKSNPRVHQIKLDRVERLGNGDLRLTYHGLHDRAGAGDSATAIITQTTCHNKVSMQWVFVLLLSNLGKNC